MEIFCHMPYVDSVAPHQPFHRSADSVALRSDCRVYNSLSAVYIIYWHITLHTRRHSYSPATPFTNDISAIKVDQASEPYQQ